MILARFLRDVGTILAWKTFLGLPCNGFVTARLLVRRSTFDDDRRRSATFDAVPRCSRQLRASRRCIGHRWEKNNDCISVVRKSLDRSSGRRRKNHKNRETGKSGSHLPRPPHSNEVRPRLGTQIHTKRGKHLGFPGLTTPSQGSDNPKRLRIEGALAVLRLPINKPLFE